MHITVAIPAYTGMVHLGTMRSLFTDLLALQARGDSWSLQDECGNALLADGRALIVAQFLGTDSDMLVFVDADVAWEAGALLRLVDHPVDMVAGIYPYRRDPMAYPVKWLSEGGELWADPTTGLLEVAGVPAGFTRMSRKQLQDMVAQYPDTEFYCDAAPDDRAWALFSDYRIGKHKMGEDYAFCRRWIDMGGKVWVDPEIKMGHIGNKTFEGHLGDWLRNRA
jgi:hypothetical protein